MEFKQAFLDLRNDLDSFFLYLMATFGVTLRVRSSLIIFDEIQLFPEAFIKHLVIDCRCDYLETGSLISIKENMKDILIPSEEEVIQMYPMDFEEFLWAMGEEALAALIWSLSLAAKGLPDSLHRKADRLWCKYMLIGGMSQAVEAYAEGRDFSKANRAKNLIVALHRNDIEKYGGLAAKRIKRLFNAIPVQLAKYETSREPLRGKVGKALFFCLIE